MGILTAILVYVCVYTVVIFWVLNYERPDVTGENQQGHAASAPLVPNIKRKLWQAAIISAVIFVLIYAFVSSSYFSLRAQAATPAETQKICAAFVAHQPQADVAYKPGVDVYGKKLVPADINSGPAPSAITVPLTLNLAQFLGISLPNTALKADATIGILTVDDGQVYFDGQKIGDAQQENLRVLCMGPK